MEHVAIEVLEPGQFIVANEGALRGIYAGRWGKDFLAVYAPDETFQLERPVIGIGLAEEVAVYGVLEADELSEAERTWVDRARSEAEQYREPDNQYGE